MTGGQNQCCTSFSVYVGSSTEQTVAKSSASESICAVTRSFLFSGGKRHCGVGGGSGGRAPWTSSPRAEAPGVVLERFISNSRHSTPTSPSCEPSSQEAVTTALQISPLVVGQDASGARPEVLLIKELRRPLARCALLCGCTSRCPLPGVRKLFAEDGESVTVSIMCVCAPVESVGNFCSRPRTFAERRLGSRTARCSVASAEKWRRRIESGTKRIAEIGMVWLRCRRGRCCLAKT